MHIRNVKLQQYSKILNVLSVGLEKKQQLGEQNYNLIDL